MLTEDEARSAYDELLEKLRGLGAHALVGEIGRAVAVGRIHEEERRKVVVQERLPATAALEIATRMLAAWIEPVILISETEKLLREASAAPFKGLRWLRDRLDDTESSEAVDAGLGDDEPVLEVRPLATSLDEVRRSLDRLHAIAAELAGAERE
jgi:hypothetical protein